MLEGLNGKADLLKKGYVSVKTLDAYVAERVKELTNGAQAPTVIIHQHMPDFLISLPKKWLLRLRSGSVAR